MEPLSLVWQIVNTGGVVGVLIIIMWLFITERIVPAKRMQEWKDLALKATQQTERGIGVTEAAIREEVRLASIEEKLRSIQKDGSE